MHFLILSQAIPMFIRQNYCVILTQKPNTTCQKWALVSANSLYPDIYLYNNEILHFLKHKIRYKYSMQNSTLYFRQIFLEYIFSEPEWTLLSHGLCQINQFQCFPYIKFQKTISNYFIDIKSSERVMHSQWFGQGFYDNEIVFWNCRDFKTKI